MGGASYNYTQDTTWVLLVWSPYLSPETLFTAASLAVLAVR